MYHPTWAPNNTTTAKPGQLAPSQLALRPPTRLREALANSVRLCNFPLSFVCWSDDYRSMRPCAGRVWLVLVALQHQPTTAASVAYINVHLTADSTVSPSPLLLSLLLTWILRSIYKEIHQRKAVRARHTSISMSTTIQTVNLTTLIDQLHRSTAWRWSRTCEGR